MKAGAAARAEDTVATLVALGIVALPLAEIAARALGTGIVGAGPLTQHLTLWIGMLGAAIAAREGKLLALATGTFLPAGRPQQIAALFAGAVGAAIAALFCLGAIGLVRNEYAFPSQVAGIPSWVLTLVMPVAFGLIAIRLAWRASSTPPGRAVAVATLAGAVLIASRATLEGRSPWPAVLLVIAAALCGAPIFAMLGGLAMVFLLAGGSMPAVPLLHAYAQLTDPTLPAIPLFTLAGFLLSEGRAPERLLRLFRAFFGWMPGGTAIVTASLCAFFTTFTGGSGVTILALGGLLLPALTADRYRDRFAVGLITASGSLGLLFPPAMPLILYGVIAANVDIVDLFIGGLLPGVLMLGLIAMLGVREGLTTGAGRTPFTIREALGALWEAKWEVLLPVIVLASLVSGNATPTESSALAALYALIIQRFVHRDLPSNREVVRVAGDAIALIGGVLIILAGAIGFTKYLIDAQIPDQLVAWTQAHVSSQTMFLLALNAFLIAVGCLMDIFSAIIVVVPLIIPLAAVYEVHPVHLAIIFIANLELGYLTPPVGLNLFLASYRFGRPLLEVTKAALPMLLILALGVLLITYVPWLTLGILRMMGKM